MYTLFFIFCRQLYLHGSYPTWLGRFMRCGAEPRALAGSALLRAIRCRGVGLTGYVRYRAVAVSGRNGAAPRSKKKRGILILLSIPLIFDSVF